jgi:hypothetical protein
MAVTPRPWHVKGHADRNAPHDFEIFLAESFTSSPGPPAMIADRDAMLRRLHELRSEHRDLDTVIARLDGSAVDQLQLQRLKKRKLKLKDEIAWLEGRLVPDIIA